MVLPVFHNRHNALLFCTILAYIVNNTFPVFLLFNVSVIYNSCASNVSYPVFAASPLSWAAPDKSRALQLCQPEPPSYSANLLPPPAKKKSRLSTHSSIPLQHSPHKFKIKGPRLPPNGYYDL